MLDRAAKLLFLLGLCVVLVLGGLYVGWKRLWPVAQIQEALDAVWDWRVNWKSYVGLEPTSSSGPRPPWAAV